MLLIDQLCVLGVVACVLCCKTVCEQALELAQVVLVHLVYVVLHDFYLLCRLQLCHKTVWRLLSC